MELTNEQWEIIAPLMPKPRVGRGRPPRASREVLNGILWVMKAGARWQDLPALFPPYQTCHRRYQQWLQDGTLELVLRALAADLKERGGIDLREALVEGSTSITAGNMDLGTAAATERSSWQLRTAKIFLAPYPLQVLRKMAGEPANVEGGHFRVA